jgi:hypothetical protein
MLEDDSPIFIDALKREMEGSNSQNASPREVYQNTHYMANFINDPDVSIRHNHSLSFTIADDEQNEKLFHKYKKI